MKRKTFAILARPYSIWLYIFAVIPLILMFGLIWIQSEGVSFDEASFSFDSIRQLGERSTVVAFYNSIVYSVITTVLSVVIGYFVAYRIFKSKFKNKFLILTILILPMWSNLLLRTEALGNIMEPNNILSDLLSRVGITLSLSIKGTALSVIIGLVSTYLPFMILPIYTALEKINYQLEEAALDLGLTPIRKFWKVIFPLSSKGIVSGSIMVFLPSLSGFAIPYILGKGNIVLVGNIIEDSFKNMNYSLGSLLAVIIVIFIFGAILIMNKVDKEGETLL